MPVRTRSKNNLPSASANSNVPKFFEQLIFRLLSWSPFWFVSIGAADEQVVRDYGRI